MLSEQLRVRHEAATYKSQLKHLVARVLLPGQLSHKVSVCVVNQGELMLNSLQLCLHDIQCHQQESSAVFQQEFSDRNVKVRAVYDYAGVLSHSWGLEAAKEYLQLC